MYNWRNRQLRAFTILEFLIVIMLSGIVVTTSMYLLNFFQNGFNKKLQYESAITDMEAFNNLLNHDIRNATILELDGFGNLRIANHNSSTILYALKGEKLFRDSESLNDIYNITFEGIDCYFEGKLVERDVLVDYFMLRLLDTFGKPHKLTFIKQYGKADLYNYVANPLIILGD